MAKQHDAPGHQQHSHGPAAPEAHPTMDWDAYCAEDRVSHHDQGLLRRDMQRKGHNPHGHYTLPAWRRMQAEATAGHQP